MLCRTDFLLLYSMYLTHFSILSATILTLLCTRLPARTTCSLRVWTFHSRLWQPKKEFHYRKYSCVFSTRLPLWIIIFQTCLSAFLKEHNGRPSLALRACTFPSPSSQERTQLWGSQSFIDLSFFPIGESTPGLLTGEAISRRMSALLFVICLSAEWHPASQNEC